MVRFGVIGTNWITESFIKAASHLEHFSVEAVYSRTTERAEKFAARHQATFTYTTLEEFAQSDKFDAVYIASPNALHASQAVLCMENGKHVLLEKPLASNEREVRWIIDTAKKHNVVMMEALKNMLVPSFRAVTEHLPKIGQVRRYFSSYCQYSSRYDAYKEGKVLNAFKPELSNGALMDIGVYCIYPMVALFGRPEELQADSQMLATGADGQGSIMFHYEKLNGVVMYSKIANSYLPSEIQGEKGSILIDNINEPTHVEIKYKDGTSENISRPQVEDSMYYEVKEFVELIAEGKTESAINSHDRSLITAALMEEARKQTGIHFPADEQ